VTIKLPSITSWKTTVAGLLSAFVAAWQAVSDSSFSAAIHDPKVQIALIVFAIGVLSKDHDVSGGTRAATPEAATRIVSDTSIKP